MALSCLAAGLNHDSHPHGAEISKACYKKRGLEATDQPKGYSHVPQMASAQISLESMATDVKRGLSY